MGTRIHQKDLVGTVVIIFGAVLIAVFGTLPDEGRSIVWIGAEDEFSQTDHQIRPSIFRTTGAVQPDPIYRLFYFGGSHSSRVGHIYALRRMDSSGRREKETVRLQKHETECIEAIVGHIVCYNRRHSGFADNCDCQERVSVKVGLQDYRGGEF
jgi:hypothetical protein